MSALLAAVRARRQRRAPAGAAETLALEGLRRGQLSGFDGWIRGAQQRMGWAAHATSYGTLCNGLALKAIRAANDELRNESLRLIYYPCLEAAFDGYALACELSAKGGDGSGRAFERGADASRFEGRAVKAAPALDDWSHGAVARELIAEWVAACPEQLRTDGAVAVRNAFAAGLMLHLYEHPDSHEDLVAFENAKPKKAKKQAEPSPAPMKENAALLDAILAAPEDDKPRLVYADWLQEQGDPRAELILVQCKLGRSLLAAGGRYGTSTGKRPEDVQELKEREVELIKRNEKAWLGSVRPFIRQWAWRRGFLTHVIGDAAKLVEGLPALAKEPIESMQLTGYKPKLLAAFRKAQPHPTVQRIELSQCRLKGSAYEVLDAPFFSKVQKLDLWGNDLSDATRLAKCALPAMRWLNLNMTKLNEDSLARLAKAPFFSRLTHLSLDFNDDLRSLKALQTARSLEWLAVRYPSELIAELQPLVAKGVRISYPPHQQVAGLGEPAPDWRQLIW